MLNEPAINSSTISVITMTSPWSNPRDQQLRHIKEITCTWRALDVRDESSSRWYSKCWWYFARIFWRECDSTHHWSRGTQCLWSRKGKKNRKVKWSNYPWFYNALGHSNVIMFIMLYKVTLTLKSVDHGCDHSNESYWTLLSCGTVWYAILNKYSLKSRWKFCHSSPRLKKIIVLVYCTHEVISKTISTFSKGYQGNTIFFIYIFFPT